MNILLVAFGKRGYGLMAHNLALSLKHFTTDVKIHLFIADELIQYVDRSMFESIHTIQKDDYTDNRGICPSKIKGRLYELGTSIGLDSFLYLDVDAAVLSDIKPLFDELKGKVLASEVMGVGGFKDIITYSVWAKNSDIWEFFGLKEDSRLCGIQSSWMYFEKSYTCDKLQEYLNYYMAKRFPINKLQIHWGGSLPDELLYQGVFAKMGIVPKVETSKRVMLFGDKKNRTEPKNAAETHYILSLYGKGTGNTMTQSKWLTLYNKVLRSITPKDFYPHDQLMRDKFLSN